MAVSPRMRNTLTLFSSTDDVLCHRVRLVLAAKGVTYDLVPVELSEEEIEKYYFGFSNEILWPLFHDLPSRCNFDPAYWRGHEQVNEQFARVIADHTTEEEDYVWVHDYQLILVAACLKQMDVRRRTGFFLHIPFPPLDGFIRLPWRFQILDALLKLRQVCCDPRLVPLASAQKIQQSAKLDLLMELLPEMLAEGRKVLLFSQFTSMLELIEEALKARDLPWVKLTGQSRNRDAIIDRFTSGEVPLFLISLKAGGVGLNLPQADTVIHYDPWWNPAVENQATDRAHRIGQKNRVFVYKLVAHGTIEERILALQERKAALADSMYSGAQARKQPLFTEGDIAELLRPLGA